MAVPSSGELLMRKLAKEKLYDDYNSVQGITGPISMYDLVNGGNTNGSGHSYDTTNTGALVYPNTVVPHSFGEWYSYDHDSTTYYNASWSPSVNTSLVQNGTDDIGHASKSAACASTQALYNCVCIVWSGTLGNGTVLYFNVGFPCDTDEALDANNRWIKIGNYGGGIGDCGINATSTYTDYVMQVSDTGVVSNFQQCSSLTSFSSSTSNVFSGVCLAIANQTYYHDGTNTLPVANDVVYSSSSGGSSNYLAAGYYRVDPLGADQYIQVGSNGVVSSVGSCSGGP